MAAVPRGNLKLAPNEELLPDGRILIRGTLRADGTRRPDRYKRAGFLNEEDRHRNKYVSRGARIRNEIQEQRAKNTVNGQYVPGLNEKMRQLFMNENNVNNDKNKKNEEREKLIHHIESLVAHIIDTNVNNCINGKGNSGKSKNFGKNVVLPLLSIYNKNALSLRHDISNHFLNNPKDKQWKRLKEHIEKKNERQLIMTYMSQLLAKKNKEKDSRRNENRNENENEIKANNVKNIHGEKKENSTEIESKHATNDSNNGGSGKRRRRRKKGGNGSTNANNVNKNLQQTSSIKNNGNNSNNSNIKKNGEESNGPRGRGTFTYGTGKV